MHSTSKTTYFLFYWAPALLFAAAIFWLSSRSGVPHLPGPTDKILHFGEFFVFSLLLWRAFAGELFGKFALWRCIAVLLIGCAYALLDEVHQSFVPGRYASIYDWFADVAGILGMITLMLSRVKWRGGGGAVNYHYEKI